MAGFNQTYAQIRNFANGSGCKNNDRIEFFMVSCLQEIWTNVCDDPHYYTEISVDVAANQAKVDISQCATITSIKVRYTVDEMEYCRTLTTGQSAFPELTCGCPPASGSTSDEPCEHTVKGTPNEFEIRGGMLCLSPCPDEPITLDIECFREVDCTLYELDDDGNIIWNEVDLPEEYHAVFANLVLSKSLADQGDFAGSTYWGQIASTGLDSLTDKGSNRYDEDAATVSDCNELSFKMIRRGTRRGCNTCSGSCCCDFEVEPILVERVYVDCDGNVIDPNEQEAAVERKFAATRPSARVGRHQ